MKLVFTLFFIFSTCISFSAGRSCKGKTETVLPQLQDGLDNVSFRHPELGGQCLDISKINRNNDVILYECGYIGGSTPKTNQVFRALQGYTADSNKFSAFLDDSNRCISIGRLPTSPFKNLDCKSLEWDMFSFRRIAVPGKDFVHLIQNVGSNRCLKPGPPVPHESGKPVYYISSVNCDFNDVQQHFVTCNAYNKHCGVWKLH